MSTWLAIEDAMVAKLKQAKVNTATAFATVRSVTSRDRKALTAQIERELLPAAYVVVSGRDVGEKPFRRAGLAQITVLLAKRSDRNDAEARRGGVDGLGIYAIAQAAAAALQGLEVDYRCRLLMLDERSIGGEDGTVFWEQRYEAQRHSARYDAKFAGSTMIGALSEVQVEIGALSRTGMTFGFPGVDGVFEQSAGTRERPIVWRGQLRALTDDALNQIERDLESCIRRAEVNVLMTPCLQRFEYCTPRRFTRKGLRRFDDATGLAVQDFELEFSQLIG